MEVGAISMEDFVVEEMVVVVEVIRAEEEAEILAAEAAVVDAGLLNSKVETPAKASNHPLAFAVSTLEVDNARVGHRAGVPILTTLSSLCLSHSFSVHRFAHNLVNMAFSIPTGQKDQPTPVKTLTLLSMPDGPKLLSGSTDSTVKVTIILSCWCSALPNHSYFSISGQIFRCGTSRARSLPTTWLRYPPRGRWSTSR